MLISRIDRYVRNHGVRAAFARGSQQLYRMVWQNRLIVYAAPLRPDEAPPPRMPEGLHVVQVFHEADLSEADKQTIITRWVPAEKDRQIRERFAQGAVLWLMKDGGRVAGFGWSIHGITLAPGTFPLEPDDVRLFDFETLPEWRGRAITPVLVANIMHWSAQQGARRALSEVHEWNDPSNRGMLKTPFRPIGTVRQTEIMGREFVWARHLDAEPSK